MYRKDEIYVSNGEKVWLVGREDINCILYYTVEDINYIVHGRTHKLCLHGRRQIVYITREKTRHKLYIYYTGKDINCTLNPD